MPQVGLHSLAFTPLWNPDEADRLLPASCPPLASLLPWVTAQGVRVIDTSLLGAERFDFIGTRHAGERQGVEIVCSLGLPDALDVMARGN